MNETLTPRADISAFAGAVRERLNDLPVDEVDDLLDGLEADLAEQADESGDAFELPDAAAYADELRAAAGLPERVEGPAPRVPFGVRMARRRAAFAAGIRANAFGAWVLDFLLVLRPLWWVVRGGAVAILLAVIFGGSWGWYSMLTSPLGVAVILAFVVVSVQWGRGRWLPGRATRFVRPIVNVVAAIAAFVFAVSAPTVIPQAYASMYGYYDNASYADSWQPGLVVDGERVRNIFPYDSEGNPLTGVQLFDEQGRQLTTVGTSGIEENWPWDQYFAGGGGPVTAPSTGTGTRPLWNVFPLLETTDTVDGYEPDPSSFETAPLPYDAVAPLRQLMESPAPTPDATDLEATPTPSASEPVETPVPTETPVEP